MCDYYETYIAKQHAVHRWRKLLLCALAQSPVTLYILRFRKHCPLCVDVHIFNKNLISLIFTLKNSFRELILLTCFFVEDFMQMIF